jgi:hypothetical protein
VGFRNGGEGLVVSSGSTARGAMGSNRRRSRGWQDYFIIWNRIRTTESMPRST